MTAIAVATFSRKCPDLPKRLREFLRGDEPEAELAHPGRIDDVAATWQVKQHRGGGRMPTVTTIGREGADADLAIRDQDLRERGFPHAGGADQYAAPAAQAIAQGVHSLSVECARAEDIVTGRAIGGGERLDWFGRTREIDLVYEKDDIDVEE